MPDAMTVSGHALTARAPTAQFVSSKETKTIGAAHAHEIAALRITTSPSSTAGIGNARINDIPESEIQRDDALGKLIGDVFNDQAPAMPAFNP